MIIKGYNGIMDLDLTNIDSKYHKELIQKHYEDIENYKIEQKKLNPELRYENTIVKIQEKKILHDKIIEKRILNKNN